MSTEIESQLGGIDPRNSVGVPGSFDNDNTAPAIDIENCLCNFVSFVEIDEISLNVEVQRAGFETQGDITGDAYRPELRRDHTHSHFPGFRVASGQ